MKLLVACFLCTLSGVCLAQAAAERLLISPRLGYVIEAQEAAYFSLLPRYRWLDSAYITRHSDGALTIHVFHRPDGNGSGEDALRISSDALPALTLYTEYYETSLVDYQIMDAWEASVEALNKSGFMVAGRGKATGVHIRTLENKGRDGLLVGFDSSRIVIQTLPAEDDSTRREFVTVPSADLLHIELDRASGFSKGFTWSILASAAIAGYGIAASRDDLYNGGGEYLLVGVFVLSGFGVGVGLLGGIFGDLAAEPVSYDIRGKREEWFRAMKYLIDESLGGAQLPPEVYRTAYGSENK